ncbi:MAG: hypothetical protein IKO65_02220 [Victivallales bacterium]|nr:hypothetical protein [Victivallales bacterium]
MKKPSIKKLKAEFEKLKSRGGDAFSEYHVLQAMTGIGTDDEEEVNTWDIDFHGRDIDWCAISLEHFHCLEKWNAEDWKNVRFFYRVENISGLIDSAEVEPWCLDENRKLIFFKKVDDDEMPW